MAPSEGQVRVFRERVLALDPPAAVIQRLDELLAIGPVWGLEDKLEDILKDACRVANWTRPWEPEGVSLTFRARKIDDDHPEYQSDTGGENSPAVEQAFRRGIDQGVAEALRILGVDWQSADPLAQFSRKVHRWRLAELHARNTLNWGSFTEPDYPCVVRTTLRRSGVTPSIRWKVLERDGRKCIVCGISAKDGAVLEVDHIVSVFHGGTDDMDNLRTLCFDCNRGKSSGSDVPAKD